MDKQTIKPNRQKKEAIVTKFADKLSRAKSVVFTDYRGMTHKQIENLKKAVKAVDAEFIVTKNTLLLRAIKQNPALQEKMSGGARSRFAGENFDELKGPTATLFSFKDIITPIKELAKAIKILNLPLIKFGILEGKTIKSDDILKLSAIPSKEVLLAQIVYGLKAPIFGLHRTLSWNIQKLVMTLKAIEAKKT